MVAKEKKGVRLPTKLEALLPIVVLLALMIGNYLLHWGADPHIPVMIAAVVAMLVGLRTGRSYRELLAGALDAVSQSLEAILLILFVGCLIGSFEWAGSIPAVVYYGLKTLSPSLFLPIACILCLAVSLALGSAWTLSATLGIAFMAIGRTMGMNPGLVAGMIISGACVGDKFSPPFRLHKPRGGGCANGPLRPCARHDRHHLPLPADCLGFLHCDITQCLL